jgi:uncharacterized protein (DUF433 family)
MTQVQPFTPLEGVWLVTGTRIPVDTILERFLDGATPEEIVLRYPALELAAVYEIIAYYLRHQYEVSAYLEQAALQQANLQAANEAKYAPVGIRGRLLSRQK